LIYFEPQISYVKRVHADNEKMSDFAKADFNRKNRTNNLNHLI
jgi:hypothetical protein